MEGSTGTIKGSFALFCFGGHITTPTQKKKIKGLYISQPPPAPCVEGRVGYPFVMLSTFSVTLSQDPALPLGPPAKYVE